MVDSPRQDQSEFPSDEYYIKTFFWVHNLPFEMLLRVGCSNFATNTIVPQFSILALSISIKNTPYKMLATKNH